MRCVVVDFCLIKLWREWRVYSMIMSLVKNLLKKYTLCALLLAVNPSRGVPNRFKVEPGDTTIWEAKMSTPALIRHKGYPVEEHYVTTDDGYVLSLHRIPNCLGGFRRTPVLLAHGIIASSSDWILTGPKSALGYLLADQGYDVWMINFRGNAYSRNHTKLDPDKESEEFWDFSWHEMGYYDLPAAIDYILMETNTKKLFHVGHSQGTTTFYVMLSTRPEYNRKIQAHFSLAPIVYMSHMYSPILRFLANIKDTLEDLSQIIGLHEFLPRYGLMVQLAQKFCHENSLTKNLCTNTIFSLCGYSKREFNSTFLPILIGHTPSGSSIKQYVHYGQMIKSGQFRHFDYGPIENWYKYHNENPPQYNLKNVKVPVYVFYSKNDWLSAVKDVAKLCRKIKNAVRAKILVRDDYFNHVDYLFGIYARDLVYKEIINIINHL